MTSVEAQQGERAEVVSLLRPLLFALAFLLGWIGTNPFADLSNSSRIENWLAGNPLNQIAWLALCGAMMLSAYMIDRRIFRLFWRPVYGVALGWIALAVMLSHDPGVGMRRLLLAAIVMIVAGLVLILPRTEREFAGLLSAIVGLMLFLCYAGVALIPDRAVHQVTDTFMRDEQVGAYFVSNLTGDWRGIFAHKNTAAPMMVFFIFIGLYVAKVRDQLLGWTIVVAAAIFLIFTRGKTATILLPVIWAMAYLFTRLRGLWTRGLVTVGGVIALNVIAVGSAYFGPIRSLVSLVLPDVTFTDRSVIWQLGMENLMTKPLFGFGFQSFWGSDQLINSEDSLVPGNATWAPDAHNSYLDFALSGGLPWLLLAGAWVLFTPLLDYQKIKPEPANRALSLLFVQIWLLGLYLGSFESILFNRDDPVWFTVLVAMFGLRLMTMSRIVGAESAPLRASQ